VEIRDSEQFRTTVMEVAKESTIKMLSYTPETVGTQLNEAAELTTGAFRDSYTDLIRDVMIPDSKAKRISAVVEVPAIAVESVDRTPQHCLCLSIRR
jgi:Mce-associated membrane protein